MAYLYSPLTANTPVSTGDVIRVNGVDFMALSTPTNGAEPFPFPLDLGDIYGHFKRADSSAFVSAADWAGLTSINTNITVRTNTWTTVSGDLAYNYGYAMRYGTGNSWVYRTLWWTGTYLMGTATDFFGHDPAPGQDKIVQVAVYTVAPTAVIRPVKPRILELASTSVALLGTTGVGTLRAYIDAQDSLSLKATGGTLTGSLYLAGAAVADNEAIALGQARSLVTNAIGELTALAPDALNVFSELAAAINNDPNAWTTLTTMIAGKAALTGATFTGEVLLVGGTTNANGAVTLSDVQSLISALPAQKVFSAEFTVEGVNVSLATTGVTAGTYTKLTVDSKGRVTAASQMGVGDVPLVTVDGTAYGYQDLANTVVRGSSVAARPAYRFDTVSTGVPISIPFSEADMPWIVSTNPARGTLTLDGIEQKPEIWSFGQNLDTATSADKPYAIILNADVPAEIEVSFRYLA